RVTSGSSIRPWATSSAPTSSSASKRDGNMAGDLTRGPRPQFRTQAPGASAPGAFVRLEPNVNNPAPSGRRGPGLRGAAPRLRPPAGGAAAAALLWATLAVAAPTPTVGPLSQPGLAFEAVTSPAAGQPFDVV